jgi:hypothetical protein
MENPIKITVLHLGNFYFGPIRFLQKMALKVIFLAKFKSSHDFDIFDKIQTNQSHDFEEEIVMNTFQLESFLKS